MLSVALSVPDSEVLLLASVKVALTSSPLVKAGVSAAVKLPSTMMPSIVPVGVVMVTVAPSSPVTVTDVPSSLISTTGAAGAVVSGATTSACSPSLVVAVISPPLVCAGARVILTLPSAPTVPLPITLPSAVVISTSAPGVPLETTTLLPSSATSTVRSFLLLALTLVGALTLPELSVAVAVMISPFTNGFALVFTTNLPLASAITV